MYYLLYEHVLFVSHEHSPSEERVSSYRLFAAIKLSARGKCFVRKKLKLDKVLTTNTLSVDDLQDMCPPECDIHRLGCQQNTGSGSGSGSIVLLFRFRFYVLVRARQQKTKQKNNGPRP